MGAAAATATYASVAWRSSRRYATYRSATLAGCFTNTAFGFFRAYVLLAMWRVRPHLGGYDATDALTYCFLGQALIAVFNIGAPLPLSERIRTGDVVVDLVRPVDLHLWWLADDAGRACYQVLARGLVPLAAGALVFRLRLPTSPLVWLAGALALVLGILVGFGLRYPASLATFWLADSRGVDSTVAFLGYFFSGLVLPLNIFPGLLGTVARLLPFGAMLQIPVDVLLGKPAAGELATAAGWALVLVMGCRWATRRATRHVVAQGG